MQKNRLIIFKITIVAILDDIYITWELLLREREHVTYPGSPAGIYLFKVNNRNIGTMCSKLTLKTPKQRH